MGAFDERLVRHRLPHAAEIYYHRECSASLKIADLRRIGRHTARPPASRDDAATRRTGRAPGERCPTRWPPRQKLRHYREGSSRCAAAARLTREPGHADAASRREVCVRDAHRCAARARLLGRTISQPCPRWPLLMLISSAPRLPLVFGARRHILLIGRAPVSYSRRRRQ